MSDATAQGMITWLEEHLGHANAYRVVDTYHVFTRGTRLEVTVLEQHERRDEYRYLVQVTDTSTGEVSEHGNGGATVKEALEEFHWAGIVPPLDEEG